MAHFFSDHQSLVADLYQLKALVLQLYAVDEREDEKLYRELVERILSKKLTVPSFSEVYEQLKADDEAG